MWARFLFTRRLIHWITVDDPAVRYGSGTVTYTVDQAFSMPTNEGVRYGAIIVAEPAAGETGSPQHCFRIYQVGGE